MQLSPIPPQRNATLVIPDDRAVYRIKEGKFFGPDDCLYLEGQVIAWDEEPNLEMEPLNNMARAAFKAFLEKLDVFARAVAEKNGTSYASYVDAHQNAIVMARQDSKRVELISSEPQVPLMGAKKTPKSRPEQITETEDAPLMGTPKKGKFSLKGPDAGRDAVNKMDGK